MGTNSVKVSIIIPVFNVEKYLKKCLKSVANQTLKEIEIIIVDDGSTDNSRSIVQEFAQDDNRIVAVKQRNKGVSATRNTGLGKARGEYVGFVDADDYVDPNYFEALYTTAKSKQADIASAYVATEDAGRQRFYNYTNKQKVLSDKKNLLGVVWLNIYKRSMLKQHDITFLPKLRTAEDNLFNLQASYYANKIESIPENESFYHHVTRSGSLMTQQYNGKSLLQLWRAVFETVKLLNSLKDYSKDLYISRVYDTFNYFYLRFSEAKQLNVRTRLKISRIFVRIWRATKYKQEMIKFFVKNGIDPSAIMYGRYYRRFYEKYIANHKSPESRAKIRVMKLMKKTAKALLPHGFVVLYKKRLEVMSKVQVKAGKASLDSRKIAVIVPFMNVKYAELVKLAVKQAEYEAVDGPSNAKYIWLHWYEDGVKNYSDFINKLSAIKTWKEQGRKVILHIHNKKPHDTSDPHLAHALMTSLADTVDRITIMSTETKNVLKDLWYDGDDFSRVSVVPHPNYIDVYGKRLKPSSAMKKETLKILFFGLVRPYKGIEYLIESTNGMKDVEISVFGNPKDDAYVAKLKELCADRDNVTFRLEFIPDADIPRLFADHHLIALPYSIESSLNSGAALLALSYGRTIVGTNNGTLKDLESRDLYFGYDYKDEADHVKQLKNTIQSIRKQYGGDYNELLKVGERAYESVRKNNSLKVVSQSIDEMIKHLG